MSAWPQALNARPVCRYDGRAIHPYAPAFLWHQARVVGQRGDIQRREDKALGDPFTRPDHPRLIPRRRTNGVTISETGRGC